MGNSKSVIAFLTFFISNSCFPIDTNIVKLLPLNVGNLWVYDYVGTGNSGRTRIRIASTITANNHLYYVFELNGNTCTCAQYTYSPFLTQLQPMRVDSTDGRLMFYGTSCQWPINEHMLDSLAIRIGDNPNNSCNYTRCYDTSDQNVFGVIRRTKMIGLGIMTYYYFRTYAKDIGLIRSLQGCTFNFSCTYSLTGCVTNGILYGDTSFPVGISNISSEVPNSFRLYQNFPNPFNPVTKIKFDVPSLIPPSKGDRGMRVRLIIYDILGREVATPVNEPLKPGTYEVEWDAANYPSGAYYYKLHAGDYSESKKMILLK